MECVASTYRGKVPGLSDSDSSDSDSDADCWKRSKQKKSSVKEHLDDKESSPTNLLPKKDDIHFVNGIRKRKINNIWTSVLEEENVSSILGQCGLKRKPITLQNRESESYDFRRSLVNPQHNKVDGEDMETNHKPLRKMPELSREDAKKKRIYLKQSDVRVAEKIIHKLGEKKHHLIFRVVYFLGVAKSMELLAKTEDVEDAGGMQIRNNKRRRTPGGVYLQLLKADKDIPKNRVDSIFALDEASPEARKQCSRERKRKKRQFLAKQKKLTEEGGEMQVTSVSESKNKNEDSEQSAAEETINNNDDNIDVEDGEILD